jgi:hypothetical protein
MQINSLLPYITNFKIRAKAKAIKSKSFKLFYFYRSESFRWGCYLLRVVDSFDVQLKIERHVERSTT